MTGAVECPSCGAPAGVLPADPRAPIACGFCGTSYERVTAEKALSSLRAEVAAWLQKTAGVAAGAGGASVDAATRTFLFNDRILPGLRREVRRAIDEKVGDVLGSAIVVPRLLFELSGFRGEDSVLLSMRNAILGLRSLRVRIESEEVSAFATTAADRMALDALRDDLDRALFASNAACALAGSFREGAMLARKNLEVLGRDPPGALLATVDPGAAMLASAMHDRCQTLNRALDAVLSTPPDGEALKQSAARLEDLSHTLLTHESRSLRSALASTGIVRDATALRVLAAVASGIERAQLPLAETLDAMQLFAPGLSEVTRHKDVAYLVHGWATAVAAKASGGGLPAIGDTSWMAGAIEQARGRDERCGRVEAMLCPYWAFSVRHSKAEGVFFVSGRQHEGLALVRRPRTRMARCCWCRATRSPRRCSVRALTASLSSCPWIWRASGRTWPVRSRAACSGREISAT
ncbi:MAG: hypothetical protein R3F14_00480 [Polyangiaceae bacterium]